MLPVVVVPVLFVHELYSMHVMSFLGFSSHRDIVTSISLFK